MRIFDEVYTYVGGLSHAINLIHGFDPYVYIRFAPKGATLEGVCNTSYRRPCMYIALTVPVDFTLTQRNAMALDVILCHEYCHYIDALMHTGRERHDSGEMYEKDQIAKKVDECRTWRQTRDLAKELGLWNKKFFDCLKECEYTSEITY